MTKIKCVIAAGGLGTRLQGFRQNDRTKILLEVNGIPMINRQIYQIKKWGHKMHLKQNNIIDYVFRSVSYLGLSIPDFWLGKILQLIFFVN